MSKVSAMPNEQKKEPSKEILSLYNNGAKRFSNGTGESASKEKSGTGP